MDRECELKFKHLAVLICLPISLNACSMVFPVPAPSLDKPTEAAPQSARFIVTFRAPTATPSAEILASIQQLTGARTVQYAGPLGSNMHLIVMEPGPGQTLSTLLSRLKAVSYLLSAELDSKARHF